MRVLIFSATFFSETFLILRRIPRDIVICVQGVQEVSALDDYNTDNTIITPHVFLASLLGSIGLLGSRPPGPE
jgi:hypothetical protein